jgi:copper(I)-binding protein
MSTSARTLLATLVLVVASCASGDPDLRVSSAQASVPVAGTSQVVLELTNVGDGDDALVAVETDAALAVELHLTEVRDGRATMRLLEQVDLAAGSTVRFRPGGLHLMMVVPDERVVVGATIPLLLRFERSPDIVVEAEVVELLDLVEGDPAG